MMKSRRKIGLIVFALLIICGVVFAIKPNRAQRELEATRRALRGQGFKVDLSEFNFTTPADVRARAATLGTTTRAALTNRLRPGRVINGDLPQMVRPASPDTALIVWKQPQPNPYDYGDLWPLLREAINTNRARFERLREAAISGPICFEPIGSGHPNALLPYLADLKNLEQTFATACLVALHDDDTNEAWTNLLAATCLVTEYTPEPIEVSHLVRVACASIAYDVTWNALQAPIWSDAQLAELQRRWNSVDFWSALPETAAYTRAEGSALFELERREGRPSSLSLKEMIRAPKYAWPAVREY